jgi:uncharacterized protein (DUF1800 family)
MSFDPHIAAIRFGTGLSPRHAPPTGVGPMLAALKGPDHAAQAAPIPDFDSHLALLARNSEQLRALRKARSAGDATAADRIRAIRRQAGEISDANLRATLARAVSTTDGLRERLTAFWADHFTTRAREGRIKAGVGAYVDSALRPRIAGRFAELLIAAVTHPMMVDYLDQGRSIGPGSRVARTGRKPGAGLNENLAREILELHTLGANGPYDQDDVRNLARVLTGLGFNFSEGRVYRRGWAEPGPHTVLGGTYREGRPEMADIEAVLTDLARHPATAAHVARKLAVHFIADAPESGLVAAMRDAFLDSDGDLMAVYAAMLAHPAAWAPEARNVKPPLLYLGSALRALDLPPDRIAQMPRRPLRRTIARPLRAMGHRWETPAAPDGLTEADGDWIAPPSLAARVQWALTVPERFGALPDPRDFVQTALGPRAPDEVRFAARAAASRRDGIGLVLMSPAFQRM